MIIPTDTPKGRYYSWDNDKFISVTTAISDGIAKPGLNRWFIKNMAELAARRRKKLAGFSKIPDAKEWLLDEYYKSKDNTAANLGSTVHSLMERISLGEQPVIPMDAVEYIDAYNAFLNSYKPVITESEVTVFSRTHGYAGTADAFMTIDGKNYVCDYKTGKSVYPEAALQMSAYRYGDFLGRPDGEEAPVPKVDGALVIHVRPDGVKVIPVNAGPDTFDTFLSALDIFRWQRIDGPHAIGETWE